MKTYSLLLLNLFVVLAACHNGQPSQLNSDDQESLTVCINKIKKDLSMSQDFRDDTETDLDDVFTSVPGDLRSGPAEFTKFERIVDANAKAFGITMEQVFRSGDKLFGIYTKVEVSSDEVDHAEGSERMSVVTYKQESVFIEGEQIKFEVDKEYRVNYLDGCSRKLFAVESRSYAIDAANPASVNLTTKNHFLFDDIHKTEDFKMPLAAHADQIFFAKLSNEDRLKIDRNLTIFDSQMGVVFVTFSTLDSIQMMNPNTGMVEQMDQFVMTGKDSESGERLFEMLTIISKDRAYERYLIDIDEDEITEVVEKKIWDETVLSASIDATDKIEVEGFDELSFFDDTLAYRVTSQAKLSFDNYSAYFSFKELAKEGDNFVYAVKHAPKIYDASLSEPFPSKVDRSYQKYLAETAYYNVNDATTQDAIVRLKTKLNENISSGLVIHAILAEVSSLLSYDHDAVGAQAVRPICSKDAIDAGKGVCQHFAAVFVAIARGLGIPARQIWGLSLGVEDDKGTSLSHAWVEILTPAKRWLPLEPQKEGSFNLETSDYFPLGVSLNYERKTGETEQLRELIQYSSQLLGLRFDKMSE